MTCYQEITCPHCKSNEIIKAGRNAYGQQRYRCQNADCPITTFMLTYRYTAYKPTIKEQVVKMAINGSGIRDTARVLGIAKNTVIDTLKKKASSLVQVNPNLAELCAKTELHVRLELACEAELDEQWSYVKSKANQRWLWYAVDHATNTVLAYVFGKRKDDVFKKLKELLEPFGISRFYTDDWGAYERHLDTDKHEVGKRNTQKIERKNLNFRTWIKRLTRKTICFSKLEIMHDTVIGLMINHVEFGLNVFT
jgi:IS1 family transposase/transposase-like protein